MKKKNRQPLVLNADYTPITVKHWTKAICLILKEKASQVDFYANDSIRDGHGRQYPVPAVIALRKYIYRDYQKAPFSSKNVFARDKYTCQYCLREFKSHNLTLDHVIPKSKWTGGPGRSKCWTNIVTACTSCNSKKADRTCEQSGMFPAETPTQPGYSEIFLGLHFHGKIEKEWITWLSVFPSFNLQKIQDTNSVVV